jgi:GAF domain-containing protein
MVNSRVDERLLPAIREFTSAILNPYDLPDLLQRLTHHATAVVGVDGAGIMLAGRREGRLGFVAASDDRVVEMEQVQDRIAAGPCYEAFLASELGVVEDLRGVRRWPEYEQRALDLGLHSVLAVPMNAMGRTIGVVDLYRTEPGPWSAEDIGMAEILMAMGAGYVLHADQLRGHQELTEQLHAALQSRDVIGQAKGILMARSGIDSNAAFERLREFSQRTNVKLRDVADQLVASERVNAG